MKKEEDKWVEELFPRMRDFDKYVKRSKNWKEGLEKKSKIKFNWKELLEELLCLLLIGVMLFLCLEFLPLIP